MPLKILTVMAGASVGGAETFFVTLTLALSRAGVELRSVLNGKIRWDHLPMNERRDLLEPVISPTFSALCTAVASQQPV